MLSDSLCFSLDQSHPVVTLAATRFTSVPPATLKRHIGVTGLDLPAQISISHSCVVCLIIGTLWFLERFVWKDFFRTAACVDRLTVL